VNEPVVDILLITTSGDMLQQLLTQLHLSENHFHNSWSGSKIKFYWVSWHESVLPWYTFGFLTYQVT